MPCLSRRGYQAVQPGVSVAGWICWCRSQLSLCAFWAPTPPNGQGGLLIVVGPIPAHPWTRRLYPRYALLAPIRQSVRRYLVFSTPIRCAARRHIFLLPHLSPHLLQIPLSRVVRPSLKLKACWPDQVLAWLSLAPRPPSSSFAHCDHGARRRLSWRNPSLLA